MPGASVAAYMHEVWVRDRRRNLRPDEGNPSAVRLVGLGFSVLPANKVRFGMGP